MNNYTSVLAATDISEGEYVRIETVGDRTLAYPVNSQYDKLMLPVACDDAPRGELVTLKS